MRTMIVISLVLLFLAIMPTRPLFTGEIYKWVDKDGVTHFSDSNIDASALKENKVEVRIVPDNPIRKFSSDIKSQNHNLPKLIYKKEVSKKTVAQPSCLFNPSTGSYQLCYHLTASGQCVHYGGACGMSGQTMYNPRTNANQECYHVTADGRCVHYGAPTGESGQCMFNRATGAYQTCLHVTAGGQCAHFGAPCN